jgi:hypothetical protein
MELVVTRVTGIRVSLVANVPWTVLDSTVNVHLGTAVITAMKVRFYCSSSMYKASVSLVPTTNHPIPLNFDLSMLGLSVLCIHYFFLNILPIVRKVNFKRQRRRLLCDGKPKRSHKQQKLERQFTVVEWI